MAHIREPNNRLVALYRDDDVAIIRSIKPREILGTVSEKREDFLVPGATVYPERLADSTGDCMVTDGNITMWLHDGIEGANFLNDQCSLGYRIIHVMINSKLISDAQPVDSTTIKDMRGRIPLRSSNKRRNEVLG